MAHPTNDQVRCNCGSLLARLVPEGIELKCRRCRRQVVVPTDALEASDGVAITVCASRGSSG